MTPSRRGHPIPFLLVLTSVTILFAASGFSAPLSSESESTCSPTCRHSRESSKLKFEEGKTYAYEFETEVSTKLIGTTDEESKIKITGNALLAAISSCEFVFTVQRAKFVGPTQQISEGVSALVDSSLRFAYQDGSIEGVCKDDLDPSWSANVKRGLISMLQNKALNTIGDTTVIEMDVSGRCPTIYKFSGTTATKTRDLNSCTHRDGGFWILQGTPYQISSGQNSNPLVKSTQTCDQVTEAGIIKTVQCTETHKLTAISANQGGAETVVTTKMNLMGTTSGIPTVRESQAFTTSTIFYDHSKNDLTAATTRIAHASTEVILGDICSQTKTGTVTAIVPGLIHSLRKTLKLVNSVEELNFIYNEITQGKYCSNLGPLEKIFKDTVAKAGTTATIVFMTKLIAQGKVDKSTQRIFSLYTNFSPRPGGNALYAFRELITRSDVDPEFILTASGLAHRYCRSIDPNCGTDNEYIQLVKSISQIGRESCMGQEEKTINLAITALQALGNLDSLPPQGVETIVECLKSSNRIKMRALEAFRRDPCQPVLKQQAFTLLKDITQTSEIRIQAYLAVARCVEQDDVDEIQQVLNTEKSNQVGSFVSSHIANIRNSPTPIKQSIRAALKQIRFPQDFPYDPRKFSTNFDYSTFSTKTNLGMSVESNVIYSQDSFIPRSTSSNLDVQLFGRSYNMEVGVSLEDFEHIAENIFGPTGKLAKTTRDELTSNAREQFLQFKSEFQSRFKRELPTSTVDMNAIDSKHDQATTMKERFDSNGLGDFYIRILGNTILSNSFTQDQLREQFMSKTFFTGFDKFLEGAKDYNIAVTEPITFLDDEFVIPTVSGLPLNLEVEGTTVLSLQLNGKMDLPSLLKQNFQSDIRSRILPSAATTVRAKMSVGSGHIESGLQLEGKIHTSSGIDVAISRQNGKFELKVNLPEDKVQVVSIRSELFWIESERLIMKETPLVSKFVSKKSRNHFCTSFSSVLGLRLCAEMERPNYAAPMAPAFPFAGDAILGISIEKIEQSMEGYYLKVDTNLQSDSKKEISIMFETPGSQTNRKIIAEGSYMTGQSPKFDLDVRTPSNNLKFEYQRWNEDSVRGIDLKLVRDTEEYSTSVKLTMNKDDPNLITYQPLISYTAPTTSGNLISGQITHDFGKKLDFDVVAGPSNTPRSVKIQGSVKIQRDDARNAEFSINSLNLEGENFGKLLLEGTAALKENRKAMDFIAKYGKEGQHVINMHGEFSNPTPKSTKFELVSSSTKQSTLNFDIKYDCVRTVNGFENTLLINKQIPLSSSPVTISQSAKYNIQSDKEFDVKNLIEVTHPEYGINFYLKADAMNKAEQASGDFHLRSGPNISASVKYDATGNGYPNYDLSGLVKFPGQTLTFGENAKKIDTNKWKYVTSFTRIPDGKNPFTFSADTDLTLKYETDDTQSEIISRVTSTALSEPLTLKSNVVSRKEFYQANLKLSKSRGDIFNVASEYRRAVGSNPSSFTSKAFLENYLDAYIEETHARGNYNFKMESTWIPTGRNIIAESKLNKLGETYKFNGTAHWDATRDLSKSATLTSETVVIQSRNGVSLDSRNIIGIIGVERRLNFVGKLNGQYDNGENSMNINYAGPDGQNYELTTKLVNENKEKSKSSQLNLLIALPTKQPFEFTLTNRAYNIELEKYLFEFTSDLKVKYRGNKNVNIQAELHSLLTNKRTFKALFEATGTAVSQPTKLDFNTDVQRGHIRTSGNAKYGQKNGDFDIDVEYDRWAPKKTIGIKFMINTPYSALRNLESNAKFGYLFTSWTNFELFEVGNFSINNGNPSSFDNGLSYINNDIEAKYNFNSEGEQLITFGAKGVVGTKKITFKANNVLRGGKDAKVTFDFQRNWTNVRLIITMNSPNTLYEKLEFIVSHKGSVTGNNYFTQIQGLANKNRITLSNRIDSTEDKKSVEWTLTDSAGVKRVMFTVNGLKTNQYNIDTIASSGEKFISTKGSLLRSGSGIEGDLTIHSNNPKLKVDHVNIKISKTTSANGGNVLSFQVLSAQQEKGSLVIEYAKKENLFLSAFEGAIAVRSNKDELGGTFYFEDKIYNLQRDSEEGRGLSVTFQLKTEKFPLKIILNGKRTSVENLVATSFCSNESDCMKSELKYKLVNGQEGSGYEVTGLLTSTSVRQTLSDIFAIKTLSKYNQDRKQVIAYEHSTKFISSRGDGEDDTLTLGYKVFRNIDIPEPKSGVDVYLPDRELGILYTKKNTAVQEYLFEGWMDRLKKPEDKLTLSVVYDKKDLYTVVLRHPVLKKELQVRSRIQMNENGYLIDTNTDLNFFKGSNPLTVVLKVKKSDSDRRSTISPSTYGVDFGLKGLVLFNVHTDVTYGGGELLTKTKFEYKNRENQLRNYNFNLDYGFTHRTLELVGPEGRMIMYSSRYTFNTIPGTNQNDGYEVRREFFLPGMADSRIFQNSVTTTFPPSAYVKMYTANSRAGEFYEGWIGFKNDKQFLAGVYNNEGPNQEVIADFNLALNNTRLLLVKTTWDNENIKKFLEKTNLRLTDTSARFKRLQSTNSEYLRNEITHLKSVISNSFPNLKPMFRYYAQELTEINDEIAKSRQTNHFRYLSHYIEFILNILGTDIPEFKRQINGIKTVFTNAADSVFKIITNLPEMINRGIEGIPKAVEAIQRAIGITFDALVNSSKFAVEIIRNLFDRISKTNPTIANQMEYLSDTSKGIGKFLKDSLIVTLQKMTEVWTSWKSSTNELIESEKFRYYFKYFIEKYQQAIVSMIDDGKRDIEAFKDAILKALPDKEVQALLQSIVEYVEKKTTQEPVDDAAAQAQIYNNFIKTIQKIKARIFTVDLKNGLIIAQIPLPMPVKSLTEIDEAFLNAVTSQKFKTPSFNYGIREIYNQLKMYADLKDMLPPFTATGLLIGSQYYKTFDDKFYHFEGKCQYLLASDFVDKNFTIVVSYKDETEVKKTITLTDHKDEVAIQSDHTVTVNGRASSIPASAGDLKVEKVNNWITARGNGFSVACSTVQDVCVVKISGFYQGKTNGLLGTYNNENFDDLNSPNGVMVESVGEMTEGWKLNQCQEKPLPVHSEPIQSLAQEKCTYAFNGRSSELRPCFGVVSPTNYQSTCESLSHERGYDANRSVCTAAYAYQTMCQQAGTTVEDSEQCIRH